MFELSAEDFELVEAGEAEILVAHVGSVEVRQADGLLSQERRALLVEGLSRALSNQLGLESPAIRVFLAPEKED